MDEDEDTFFDAPEEIPEQEEFISEVLDSGGSSDASSELLQPFPLHR